MTRTLPHSSSMASTAPPSFRREGESTVNGHAAYDSPQDSLLLRRGKLPTASEANRPCLPTRPQPLQPLSLYPANAGSPGPFPTRQTSPGPWTSNAHQEDEDVPGSPQEWDAVPSRGPQRPMRTPSRSGHSAKKSAKLLGISPLDALHQYAAEGNSPSTPSSASSRSTMQASLPDFPCQREDLTRHRMLHDSAQKQSTSPRSLTFSLSRRKPFKPRDFVLTSLFKPAKPTTLSESSAFTSPSSSRAQSLIGSDLEMDLGHIRDPMIPAACVHSFKLDETREWERLILTPGSYVTVVDPAIATGGKKTDHAWFLKLSGVTLKRNVSGGVDGATEQSARPHEGRHAEWLVQLRSKDELKVWQVTIQVSQIRQVYGAHDNKTKHTNLLSCSRSPCSHRHSSEHWQKQSKDSAKEEMLLSHPTTHRHTCPRECQAEHLTSYPLPVISLSRPPSEPSSESLTGREAPSGKTVDPLTASCLFLKTTCLSEPLSTQMQSRHVAPGLHDQAHQAHCILPPAALQGHLSSLWSVHDHHRYVGRGLAS